MKFKYESEFRIKEKEFIKCQDNGIDLVEVKIGYDGIVIANTKKASQLNISKRQINYIGKKSLQNAIYMSGQGLC